MALSTSALSLVSGTSASELRLFEPSGSGTNYSGFKAQATTANLIWSLPNADSSGTQCIVSNGSLVLSFTACSGANVWTRSGTVLAPTTAGDTVGAGDGSTTAPGYAFASEAWTGMYRPGTGILGFSVGTGITTANRALTITNNGSFQRDFRFYNQVSSGTDSVNLYFYNQNASPGVQDIDVYSNSLRLKTASAYFEMLGTTEPAAPVDNAARLYVGTSGGKDQLCVRFATGVSQCFAVEP